MSTAVEQKPVRVAVATILVETSPQAIPLGSACVVSAIQAAHFADCSAELVCVSYDEAKECGTDAASLLTARIMEKISAWKKEGAGGSRGESDVRGVGGDCESGAEIVVAYSLFVWNSADCIQSARAVREQVPGALLVCGGAEVTARYTVNAGGNRNSDPSPNRADEANGKRGKAGQKPRENADNNPHAALTPKNAPNTQELSVFDYAVTGEGETAIVNLIRSLLSPATDGAHGVRGGTPLGAPKNGPRESVQKSAPLSEPVVPPVSLSRSPRLIRGECENCDTLPSPWLTGTLDPVDYNGVLWELSRGCPFACSYCFESKGEKTVRTFPIARLSRELDFFAQKKVPQLFVLDPTFNADKVRALKLLRLMEQKLPDAHYQFEVRAEFLDKELTEAFSHLACSLQIGLQSANPRVLKSINRAFDAKTFARKIALLNDYGIVFGFDLIYGLPLDTFPSFKDSVDYALALYPNHLEIFRLSVLPGTALFDEAETFGIKADSDSPYHVQLTPQFSAQDLAKAEQLAFACTVFYSAGRAVPWFLSVLKPLKIKPSQFLADFAEWLRCNNCAKSTGFDPCACSHAELERMQLSFLVLKYEEKHLEYAIPAVKSVVCLNGALSRVVGEGEESVVESAYHPDDIFSGQAMELLAFADETCMERCTVRFFEGVDGPDYAVE